MDQEQRHTMERQLSLMASELAVIVLALAKAQPLLLLDVKFLSGGAGFKAASSDDHWSKVVVRIRPVARLELQKQQSDVTCGSFPSFFVVAQPAVCAS